MATSQVLPTPLSGGGTSGGLSADFFTGFFGDGGDGNVTITGTTTLTREMHYNNLTVNAAGRLKPNGNRIFVSGTLTIFAGGSIDDDGTSATNQVGPTGFVARNYLGGAGTNAGSGWSIVALNQAAGAAGVANGNSSPNSLNAQPVGGAGGNSSTRSGGAGGAAPANAINQRSSGRIMDGRGTFGGFNGGAGGGGGAVTVTTYTSGTFISGGGGTGAGVVWIAAKAISNNGNISAKGGNGANASVGVGVGDVGGGGGGGGGIVWIITKSTSVGGTVSVAGGTGGTGAGVGGPVGSNGVAGTDGSYDLLVLS
jgi:hypothetical protein